MNKPERNPAFLQNNFKLQSATEYLITYGLALLVVAVVAVVIYSYVSVPQAAPSICVFSSYVTCKQVTIGSNSAGTQAVVLLSNAQSYAIENPSLVLNSSLTGTLSVSCTPSFVLPGGLVECTLTSSKKININQLTSGNLYFTTTVCSGGSNGLCNSPLQQTYAGAFSTHITPPISPQCTISFVGFSKAVKTPKGILYKTVAELKLFGYIADGGTLYFTTNSANAIFSPNYVDTDSYGYAPSYVTSNANGNVLLTATFGSLCSSSTGLNFLGSTKVTFKTNQSNTAANTLLLNNVWYQTLPVTTDASNSFPAAYYYNSLVQISPGLAYAYNSISGCGATLQAGSLSPASTCTVTANYINQAHLTMASSPSGAGILTPSSGWYNFNTYTINAIPNSGYTFNSWNGVGTGSYSGTSGTNTITLGNVPITETATFNSQPNTYSLTVNAAPSGTVSCNGGSYSSSCGGSFSAGTQVTIRESNSSTTCYKFSIWGGSGSGNYIGANTVTNIVVNGNIVETATFNVITVTVTGASNPGEGYSGYSAYSYLTGNSNSGNPNATNAFTCGSSVSIDWGGNGNSILTESFNTWNGIGPGSYSGTAWPYVFNSLSSSITETAEITTSSGRVGSPRISTCNCASPGCAGIDGCPCSSLRIC